MKEDDCLRDIAGWYINNLRGMITPDLDEIVEKHYDEAEAKKFLDYLETEAGEMRFRLILREEKTKIAMRGGNGGFEKCTQCGGTGWDPVMGGYCTGCGGMGLIPKLSLLKETLTKSDRLELHTDSNKGETLIEAYRDSQLAGQLSMIEHDTTITIAMILVQKQFRGDGVGKELVLKALDYAQSVGKPLLSGSLSGSGHRLLLSLVRDGYIQARAPTAVEERADAEYRYTMLVIEPQKERVI